MNFPDIEETVSIVKGVEGGSEPKQVGRKKKKLPLVFNYVTMSQVSKMAEGGGCTIL